jgi:hypothetical protein
MEHQEVGIFDKNGTNSRILEKGEKITGSKSASTWQDR